MRIVFVSAQVIHGGAERRLTSLLAELDRSSIERVVFLADGPFVAQIRDQGHPVEVIETSARSTGILRSALRLRRLLRRTRPDLVHADGVKGAVVATLATLPGGPPVLWVKNDFSWDGPIVRLVAARCRTIVVVSKAVAEGLGRRARSRTRVVHTGLRQLSGDRAEGRRRLEHALGPVERARVVGLVGRLDPIKGHRELLTVAAALRERVPDVRIVFIGADDPNHPDEERDLRAEAAARGIDDIVAFLGFQEPSSLPDLVAACDVVAVPTIALHGRGKEGFGNAGLEAMALGTPVVGYAQGGVPELVGECGLLVPPGDRDALLAALVRVLTEEGLHDRLAICGQARVAEQFTLARMVEGMETSYRDTVFGAT